MRSDRNLSEITPKIHELSSRCEAVDVIERSLFDKYNVKRGLRDENGKGVLTGLTGISDVRQVEIIDGKEVPVAGKLFYRGINVVDLISGCLAEKRPGFEETTYLLLFGKLPDKQELDAFTQLLSSYRTLPPSFVRDVIMKAPSSDLMNSLARGVLTLYAYDDNANDISTPNVLRQCLQLIAMFPLLAVYGYQAYRHYFFDESLFIHTSNPELSTAENLLHLLRADSSYTELEARVLDIALILHAEHGGGNNSTFTTRVVTSSGTDTYSAIAAALGSLKGPRHGGANIKVVQMFDDMKRNVRDWTDDEEISSYLRALLYRKAFDRSGLIYGVGHAVYTISDPREQVFRSFVGQLAGEKGYSAEFDLYDRVSRLAPQLLTEGRSMNKQVSPNVDFWSGFAYRLLGLPEELFTPIFAVARITGWSAHRMEELINNGKLIRPAYKSICVDRDYIPLTDR